MLKKLQADLLAIQVFEDRQQLGIEAAKQVAASMLSILAHKEHLNMIFAAAPSQNEFLWALRAMDLPWDRINAFHMDEYIGLPSTAPQLFSHFLKEALFGRVAFRSVHYLNGNAASLENEMERYEALLLQYPVDLVCMGIGENGHIAFNDPPVANFNDHMFVKKVELDPECRLQQVNDGCFASLGDVPRQAITLTIPALMKATHLFCMVPGEKKATAVYNTLYAPVTPAHPSTILRTHPKAVLFVDHQSAANIN